MTLGNKGLMEMNFKGGKFFNADDISFVDYKHFNGNQTHVSGGGNYTNVFNNLPYYSASFAHIKSLRVMLSLPVKQPGKSVDVWEKRGHVVL